MNLETIQQASMLNTQLQEIEADIKQIHAIATLLTNSNTVSFISISVLEFAGVHKLKSKLPRTQTGPSPVMSFDKFFQKMVADSIADQAEENQARFNEMTGDSWKNIKAQAPVSESIQIEIKDTDTYNMLEGALALLQGRKLAIKAELLTMGIKIG